MLLLAPQQEVLVCGLHTNGNMNRTSKVVPLIASLWKASMSTTAISLGMLLTLPVNHLGGLNFFKNVHYSPLLGFIVHLVCNKSAHG